MISYTDDVKSFAVDAIEERLNPPSCETHSKLIQNSKFLFRVEKLDKCFIVFNTSKSTQQIIKFF